MEAEAGGKKETKHPFSFACLISVFPQKPVPPPPHAVCNSCTCDFDLRQVCIIQLGVLSSSPCGRFSTAGSEPGNIFLGGIICFHLRWPMWRSGIFTHVLHVGTVLSMCVGFPLYSWVENLLIIVDTENSGCFSVRLVKRTQTWEEPSDFWPFTLLIVSHLLYAKDWQGMPSGSSSEMRVKLTRQLWSEPLSAIGNKFQASLSTDAVWHS